MAIERTLSIIKPDAVAKNVIGKIYSRFETNGLKIVAAQMRQLSQAEAEGFYAVHRERPFFADLVKFMTSGPEEGRPGHDPRRLRRKHRRQRRPRLRRSGNGRRRNRLLLPGPLDPLPLIDRPEDLVRDRHR